jgi:hypothetical protein
MPFNIGQLAPLAGLQQGSMEADRARQQLDAYRKGPHLLAVARHQRGRPPKAACRDRERPSLSS